MATRVAERWTFEDYFAWEEQQELRHEFIGGEVYAMTGGTLRHGRVILRLLSQLETALRNRPCVPFPGEVKLHVRAVDRSYYPDAFVCCDPAAMQARGVVTDAAAIFEVLSSSTAAFNYGGKFADYRLLPSLRHYVLIDPEAFTLDAYVKVDGRWQLVEPAGEALVLDAIDFTLDVPALFEGLGDPEPAVTLPSSFFRDMTASAED